MKFRNILIVVSLIAAGAAYAKGSNFLGKWPFSAPGLTDPDELDPKTPGDIVYDTSNSKFVGWNGATWTELDKTIPNLNVVSYASGPTTYTTTTSDDVVMLNGTSCNVALYTASGNSGKVITIIHNGTSLSEVFTLTTTGGQTVGGVASGSYALYTKGERLKLVSDGSNWIILEHETTTAWASFTPTYTGLGTVTNTLGEWRRVGSDIEVNFKFATGTHTATEMRISLPTGVTSSSNIPTLQVAGGRIVGRNEATTASVLPLIEPSVAYLTFANLSGSTNTLAKINGNALASTKTFSVFAQLPVSGWQP